MNESEKVFVKALHADLIIKEIRVDIAGMTLEQLAALQEDVADWLQEISENVRTLCEELLQEAIDAKRQ